VAFPGGVIYVSGAARTLLAVARNRYSEDGKCGTSTSHGEYTTRHDRSQNDVVLTGNITIRTTQKACRPRPLARIDRHTSSVFTTRRRHSRRRNHPLVAPQKMLGPTSIADDLRRDFALKHSSSSTTSTRHAYPRQPEVFGAIASLARRHDGVFNHARLISGTATKRNMTTVCRPEELPTFLNPIQALVRYRERSLP